MASSSDSRSLYALIVAIAGLAIPAFLVVYLTNNNFVTSENPKILLWDASAITAVAGIFTGIVGTLVGAFLGVQVGAAGKQKAEERANTEADNAKAAREQAATEATRATEAETNLKHAVAQLPEEQRMTFR